MLRFRKASIDDLMTYFEWANDIVVREQSFNSKEISFEEHIFWFNSILNDPTCLALLFQDKFGDNIGQVRIQNRDDKNAEIGVSVSFEHRGKGYATEMLKIASSHFLTFNPNMCINAYIKESNLSSKLAFERANYRFKNKINYKGFTSFHYIKEQE